MDAQTLRRVLWDLIRFNPKDFTVQGTPTGYNVSARNNARPEDPVCYLGLFDSTETPGSPQIGVRWGKINGRQPIGFNSRGKTASIPISTTPSYIYAYATLDTNTMLWVDAGVIVDPLPDKPNTATTGYELLGVVELNGTRIQAPIAFTCGHVTIDICDLSLE